MVQGGMNMNTSSGHPVLDVAQKVLEVCARKEETRSVTPMQLLKLVYLCHAWTLGLLGRPLVREPVQAWKYGPVFPGLYHAIKDFRSAPVPYVPGAASVDLDESEQSIVDQVCAGYGTWTGIELSRLTHKVGSPWYLTWGKCKGGRDAEISADIIEDYYKALAKG